MTRDELNNAYFDWMYQLVCDDEYSRGLSYRKLLYLLHDTDFTFTIALDSNRYDDGIDLRYRFGNEQGYRDSMIASYLVIVRQCFRNDYCPCYTLRRAHHG